MSGRTAGRGLFLPVPLEEDERVLRSELAGWGDVVLPIFIPTGRLFLTNTRVIWSPLFVYSWTRLVRRAAAIPLIEIRECELEQRSWVSPVVPAIRLLTDEATYRFYIGGAWTRASATAWIREIKQAVSKARQWSGPRSA